MSAEARHPLLVPRLSAVSFLYHGRPALLRGETLYPLNALREIDPELYLHERRKYVGREAVLEFTIPVLDVLWNDTIHLSRVHPSQLASAWRSAGLWSTVWERDFFKIPVARIAELRSVWFASESFWVNNSPNEDVPLAPPREEFSTFDPRTYQELLDVPASYHAYLRRQRERGRPALPASEDPARARRRAHQRRWPIPRASGPRLTRPHA